MGKVIPFPKFASGVKLEQWTIESMSLPFWGTVYFVRGIIYGHPGSPDGEMFVSSHLISFDLSAKKCVTYAGTTIMLGEQVGPITTDTRSVESIVNSQSFMEI